jgi:hypothetical protein
MMILESHVVWNLEVKRSQLNMRLLSSKCQCCIKWFMNNVAQCKMNLLNCF